MIFLSDYSNAAEFGRKIGSKDKSKRKQKVNSAGLTPNQLARARALTVGTAIGGTALGAKLGSRWGIGGAIVGGYTGLAGGMMALGEHRRRWLNKYRYKQGLSKKK